MLSWSAASPGGGVLGFTLSVPFALTTGPALICSFGLLALLAWGVRRLRG